MASGMAYGVRAVYGARSRSRRYPVPHASAVGAEPALTSAQRSSTSDRVQPVVTPGGLPGVGPGSTRPPPAPAPARTDRDARAERLSVPETGTPCGPLPPMFLNPVEPANVVLNKDTDERAQFRERHSIRERAHASAR